MPWLIYDLATGAREGTAQFHLDDSVYAAQGRGQIEYPDGTYTDDLMVDVTRTPPALVPVPPGPYPAG